MRRHSSIWLAIAAVWIGCFVPFEALGDEPTPSIGIPTPDRSLATQSDATSLDVNPAGLGYLHGTEGGYSFFLPTEEYRGLAPSGHALNLGTGSQIGGLGAEIQWLHNPPMGQDRQSYRRFTTGAALSPWREFSMGATLNFFSSRTDERLNSLRTTTLGLQWRPIRAVGVGAVARDAWPAFLDEDRSLPMRLGTSVALRGFDGRLVYETELNYATATDDVQLRPRLATEPYAGVRLFGQGEVDVPLPDRGTELGLSGFSVGMELSVGTMGVQGARHIGEPAGLEPTEATGMSYRLWAGTPQKRPLISPLDRWVKLRIDDSLTEEARSALFGPSTRSFLNFINDIDAIADDPGIAGVVLEVRNHNLGHAQIWELYEAVDRLETAGKESIAVIDAEAPTTDVIYTASAAEEVWMRPTSPYSPTGLDVELTSYASFLDRVGIEAEFMRIGEYKSAPESFVLPGPSEPAVEQTRDYLDTVYDTMLERIAERRGIQQEELRDYVDESPLYPHEAMEVGLVDEVLYDEEIDQQLRGRVESPLGVQTDYRRREIADERWGGRPEIAVVYVEGPIVAGESGQTPFGGASITGARTLTETLDNLRRNDNVKAVVVRVDSPGGSAVGSDLIYRELRNLARQKPVVASMGNTAASGGYYVAAGADEILATPVTLTGSIGAYAGKFNVASLADRLGINIQREHRGERAGVFSPWFSWTDEQREGIAESLEYFYQLFIQQVARTRPLDAEEIDEVARGRIWTGEAARDRQLVDQEGGIAEALRRAEELAELRPGEALYTDYTGAGGRVESAEPAADIMELVQLLGAFDQNDAVMPDGQLPGGLQQLERALMWPLYYDADEVVFLPPFQISEQ